MGKKIKSIEARVIFKAIDIINGNACHFITFEEPSTKERVYLQVGIGNYMMIVEGDRGVLNYKEQRKRYKSKFKSFERTIYGARQESIIMAENHEDEVLDLDEEIVAVLEAEKEPVDEENSEDEVADLEEEVIDLEEEVTVLEAEKESVSEENSEDEVVNVVTLDEKEVLAVSKKKRKKKK